MKVILKKDLKSAKFNVVFKKGIALNYNEGLKSVEHPTESNIWLRVTSKQFEEVKNYVITGDNNFWYSTTGYVTKKQLKTEIEVIKIGIKNNEYGNNDEPNELHIFETGWTDTIN